MCIIFKDGFGFMNEFNQEPHKLITAAFELPSAKQKHIHLMQTFISTANYDTIVNHKDRSLPATIPTSSSDSYPQQYLQHDQPNFSIEELDDYSFAPILRTNSFECDDSTEVWYTPPATEEASVTSNGLERGASKSAPVPTLPKDLDLPNVSHSMPTTPSSLDAQKTRSKPKINLAFKLRGFKSGARSMFGREAKKNISSSESSISVNSVQADSVQMDSLSCTYQDNPSSSCSVTGTEITEFASNLTSRLVHEVLNINEHVDDSFDECHLNPLINVGAETMPESNSNASGVISMSCDVLEAVDKEVELVYNDSGKSGFIMKTIDSDSAHNFEEDCDVYFTGGSLDTIHEACGEFTSSSGKSPNNTPLKPLTNLTSPATMDTSGSISSFSSGSSTQSSTSGILKPPKRAAGYDPFGKNTDFTLPKQRQVLFLENIEEVEMASAHLLSSRDTDSDDSTLSIEYAMRYFGCSSGLYSSSSSSRSDEDFLPVKK